MFEINEDEENENEEKYCLDQSIKSDENLSKKFESSGQYEDIGEIKQEKPAQLKSIIENPQHISKS